MTDVNTLVHSHSQSMHQILQRFSCIMYKMFQMACVYRKTKLQIFQIGVVFFGFFWYNIRNFSLERSYKERKRDRYTEEGSANVPRSSKQNY